LNTATYTRLIEEDHEGYGVYYRHVVSDELHTDLYCALRTIRVSDGPCAVHVEHMDGTVQRIDMSSVVNKYHGAYDVYIGRGSKWGNPFHIGQHGSREEVVHKYEMYLAERLDLIRDIGTELRGKRLGCFCAPQLCHGDILCKYVDASYGDMA
jgi:hypothetical protein